MTDSKKVDPEKTVPCGTCGTPTTMIGTKRCTGCWEVESRLGSYLDRGGKKAEAAMAEIVRRHASRRAARTGR